MYIYIYIYISGTSTQYNTKVLQGQPINVNYEPITLNMQKHCLTIWVTKLFTLVGKGSLLLSQIMDSNLNCFTGLH